MSGKFGHRVARPELRNKPMTFTDEQRRMVEAMSSFGVTQAEICKVLDISINTLHKHFRTELDTATIRANAKVAGNLFKQATKDDFKAIPAAIFWAKTRMRWKENVEVTHTGSIDLNFSSMSDKELDEFIAARTIDYSPSIEGEGEEILREELN
jgi:DNA-binding CsgD family transcriptional regulator